MHLCELTRNPSVKVAVKEVAVSGKSRKNLTAVQKEYKIHRRLSKIGHENVIQMMKMIETPKFYSLVMEYADGGDLFDELKEQEKFSRKDAHSYFKQLIKGLKFIHEQGIVHRDIKLENLLLVYSESEDDPGTLKITDFGLATKYRKDGEEIMLSEDCGSKPYAAPEVCTGNDYRGPPVDIWSAGVVLMTMLVGEHSWKVANKEKDAAYSNWINAKDEKANLWNVISGPTTALLRKLLHANPEKRATMAKIEADPWFRYNYGKRVVPKSEEEPAKRACHSSI